MTSLKQFIRNVRSAKTIADERAVVQKESAAIRASFREESHDSNVRQSSDLNHSNQYIVGLALCTLGNIASVEMSRDLFAEVESLITTANPYIRRKAALCAMRICRKVPDLQEHFLEKAKILLSDRNHGVLLCALTLAIDLCEHAEEFEEGPEDVVEMFRPLAGPLVKVLKSLTTSGYAPEHDVSGVTDPFLQVKILRFLRVLGRGDAATSELINDILAQVATNTESSKNVGNAILYEAVLTILDIEADSGLRVLGVNILGKFLSNKDNNIRYVALNTLIKVVAVEPNAVQRHRNTILDCLRDPDISIRRRALDLSFTLINEGNIRVLVRELLAFLEVADNEFKPAMTSQIGIAADRFAPNKRWHVDTMLRVLKLAGSYVKEQILSSFVRLIATTPDLQTYAAQKLYAALKADITQEGLTLAASWVIGEYGDALLQGGQYEEEELVKEVRESDIMDLFTNILNSTSATQIVTEYITTAIMKLSVRMSDPSQVERVRRFLTGHTADLNVEVQQRSVEYSNLFGYDQIRRGVLERMPPPEIREEQRVLGEPTNKRQSRMLKDKTKKPVKQTEDMLLDLMGGSDVPAVTSPTGANGVSTNTADLLADILGGGSGTPSPAPQPTATSNTSAIMDLFGSNGTPPPARPQTQSPLPTTTASQDLLGGLGGLSTPSPASPSPAAAHTAFNKDELALTLQVQRNASGSGAQILARFRNQSDFQQITSVGLQAAVPKSQRLQLSGISKADLGGGEEGTQAMKIAAVGGALPPKLRLRLRISYGKNGATPVTEQVDWTEP
ncbi:AP-1 complex subunit gamma-1 [Talaromyces atroroseus]|uniref:AP-1 complex subunit gamma n=1 Tax=Talaromyces atroroseus TaxID=1441469 RepID=A0A1Q5Q875_TALAT|nr:AP-1 complex subunit gamma-1 [Talaromyces atroroseus]OKL60314.1 AP-1 complex subunit gamma-1 [Talaromyces atroroseus]